MAKTHEILTAPCAQTVVHPRTYTEEQQAQIRALREYGQTVALPESDPYHIWEQRWLEKWDTIPRYMRAAKWRLDDAKKRLLNTLEWRREYKPDLMRPDEVRIEGETGKILLTGYDKDGRPVVYINPARENTEEGPRQLRFVVWVLERAKDFQLPGQDSVAIIVDYKTTTLRTNPSLSSARKFVHILQNHYPETLGRGLVVNLPYLLAFFYRALSPFLDPVTRDKIRFNENLPELIPAEQLDAAFGGTYEFEFESKSYWEQLLSHCNIAPDGTRTNWPAETVTQKKPDKSETTGDVATVQETVEDTEKAAEGESNFPSESSSETAVQVSPLITGMEKLGLVEEHPHEEEQLQAIAVS